MPYFFIQYLWERQDGRVCVLIIAGAFLAITLAGYIYVTAYDLIWDDICYLRKRIEPIGEYRFLKNRTVTVYRAGVVFQVGESAVSPLIYKASRADWKGSANGAVLSVRYIDVATGRPVSTSVVCGDIGEDVMRDIRAAVLRYSRGAELDDY